MRPKLRMAIAVAALLALATAVAGCAPAPKLDPNALKGEWVAESFGGPDGLIPADEVFAANIALSFGATTGTGGVNRFSGKYEATDDGSISFGPRAQTRMTGDPSAMAQEKLFFEALDNAEHFEFDEDKLVLSDKGNNTLVVLVRAPE